MKKCSLGDGRVARWEVRDKANNHRFQRVCASHIHRVLDVLTQDGADIIEVRPVHHD